MQSLSIRPSKATAFAAIISAFILWVLRSRSLQQHEAPNQQWNQNTLILRLHTIFQRSLNRLNPLNWYRPRIYNVRNAYYEAINNTNARKARVTRNIMGVNENILQINHNITEMNKNIKRIVLLADGTHPAWRDPQAAPEKPHETHSPTMWDRIKTFFSYLIALINPFAWYRAAIWLNPFSWYRSVTNVKRVYHETLGNINERLDSVNSNIIDMNENILQANEHIVGIDNNITQVLLILDGTHHSWNQEESATGTVVPPSSVRQERSNEEFPRVTHRNEDMLSQYRMHAHTNRNTETQDPHEDPEQSIYREFKYWKSPDFI